MGLFWKIAQFSWEFNFWLISLISLLMLINGAKNALLLGFKLFASLRRSKGVGSDCGILLTTFYADALSGRRNVWTTAYLVGDRASQ